MHSNSVGVVRGVGIHGQHRTRARVEHNSAAFASTQLALCKFLQLAVQCELHFTCLVDTVKCGTHSKKLLFSCSTRQHVAVQVLYLRCTIGIGVIPTHIGKQLFRGVFTLIRISTCIACIVCQLHRARNNNTITSNNGATRRIELPHTFPVVQWVRAQVGAFAHLPHIELHKEQRITRQQPNS